MEKTLKEAGVVSAKTKKSTKEGDRVREYKKSGGLEQLENDFEKIEGFPSKSDGLDLKTQPDGTKILKRPIGSDSGHTLEVQPPKGNPKYPDHRIRIKMRYLGTTYAQIQISWPNIGKPGERPLLIISLYDFLNKFIRD